MARIKYAVPHTIDPSLIETGDEISVQHKKDQGVELTLRGIVGKRVDSGNVRYLCTKEGATLLAWEPSRKGTIKVLLWSREEITQQTLFSADFLDETKDRIAS